MKAGNLLEPTYFNRKNQSLTLQEAKKLAFLGTNLIKNTNNSLTAM